MDSAMPNYSLGASLPFDRYQIILLAWCVAEAHACEQLAQGRSFTAERPDTETAL